MIDLCISGISENIENSIEFKVQNETKIINQFSNHAHFSLEENKAYRIHFAQKSEQYIPRYAEIILNILFLPVRGFFNILTFNNIQEWEKEISTFKIFGYIDVILNEDTEISFKLKHGSFDKNTNSFSQPEICFSDGILYEQSCIPNPKEITKKHRNYLLNLGSSSAILFALLFYLVFVGFKNHIYVACIVTSFLIVSFLVLIVHLVLYSFKKKYSLLNVLKNQHNKHN